MSEDVARAATLLVVSVLQSSSLRVMFVCQNDFGAPSEKQVLGFAQQLVARGHCVLVSVGGDPASAQREGATGLAGLDVRGHAFRRGRLRDEDYRAAAGFGPQIVHAWNSRVPTVAAATNIARVTGAKLLFHFEDDEWHSTPDVQRERFVRRHAHRARRRLSSVNPSLWWESTPRSLSVVVAQGDAFDALTPVLADEVRARLGRPCAVIRPITPEVPAFSESPPALPKRFEGRPVALITGTIWPMYLPDFELAFKAVTEVQRRGHDLCLLHAGRVMPRWDALELAMRAGMKSDDVAFLGYLPFAQIPPLLRRVDILLQPGPPSEFNRLRLPAKLQAYLASGTPTVSFAVGFGEELEDRHEILKTHTDDPLELAERIVELLDDDDLCATLSREGPRAAARLFDPVTNTDALEAHYRRVIEANK